MAEVKNSFLQSKMNKDLDDRLIPNGQYRDALNISVGKAEDKAVGALEGELGNQLMVDASNTDLVCIGQISDNQNNRVFQFWTDYTAPEDNLYAVPAYGSIFDMRITMYDPSSNSLITLVSGIFLNFATNNPFRIIGANVLENLLFWTDNRNQPRKINITTAINNNNYYTEEEQISVAKYAPVFPISVYSKVSVTTTSIGVIPTSPTGNAQSISFNVSSIDILKLKVGMQLIYPGASTSNLDITDYAVITKIKTNTVTVSIPIESPVVSLPSGSVLTFYGTTMTNESDTLNWSGDPNFLKEKFVRFSYRYKFDDGEYSLMAPFTQVMFIPNQNGYFLNGDETDAYRSTVVTWFENYINNIILHIQLPDTGNNIGNSYKITSIDILYKESDSNTTKVAETVSLNQIALIAGDTSDYVYTYKSQKPYKTLPESQTVRVYDKVPIRARAQEITGNRVVYGNFINQNTPPANLDYNLAIISKQLPYTSWIEYPNHTLKQNRNYQAGFILADKFGRQSSVILSSNDLSVTNNGTTFTGSTIYSPYFTEANNLEVKNWRGNTLALILNSPISSTINQGAGTPGLYAVVDGIDNNSNGFQITSGTVSGSNLSCNFASSPAQRNYPKPGNYLRGKYKDYVKVLSVATFGFPIVTSASIDADGAISDIYNFTGTSPDIKYSYNINPLGWYSYKIVVRQQQQEYYNVYLPGMLNGYPMNQSTKKPGDYSAASDPTIFPTGEINKTAHVVLINDNINKIPRDLTEVGPDQKQYRSSVQLFGRVENALESTITFNKQYFPARKPDTASTIATSADLNFLPLNAGGVEATNQFGTASSNIYQLNTTPLIARISTVNKIGVVATDAPVTIPPITPVAANTMNPFLSIYETAPTTSLLELFWETSTAGMISDINADVLKSYNSAVGFNSFIYTHNEFQDPAGTDGNPANAGTANCRFVTNAFQPINASGALMTSVNSIIMTVKDLTGVDRTNDFILYPYTAFTYAIKINTAFRFLTNASTLESYEFTFNIIDATNGNSVITRTGHLNNSIPIITAPTLPIPTPPLYSVFLSPNPIIGPVYQCLGTNGAPTVAGDANFNQEQLQWTLLNTSTPNDYDTFFDINPTSGVISLINNALPNDIPYTLIVRLTDVYNYTLNTPSTTSLYADSALTIIRTIGDNHCEDWTSQVSSVIPTQPKNLISGSFNFWREFYPGETIDAGNSNVTIIEYTTIDANYPAPYFVDTASFTGSLTWEDANQYQGNFGFQQTQETEGDFNPVSSMHVVGSIRVLPSGRTINVDFISTPTVTTVGNSQAHTCNVTPPYYLSTTLKNWKLTNNGDTQINWTALTTAGTGYQVIGGVLNPGDSTGSIAFGYTAYHCIYEYSLVFGNGGTALYSSC